MSKKFGAMDKALRGMRSASKTSAPKRGMKATSQSMDKGLAKIGRVRRGK